MAEGGDIFPDAELQGLARGVCKIEMTDSSGNHFKGTGFLFGGGWVMSVAHNFQDDDRDHSKIHSMIKTAKFTFYNQTPFMAIDVTATDGAKVIKQILPLPVFEPQERMAFIHHLEPGEDVDFKNEDIAMIKLGHQWEYMREYKDYKEWEIHEQDILDKNKLPAFVGAINRDEDKLDDIMEETRKNNGENEPMSGPIIEVKDFLVNENESPDVVDDINVDMDKLDAQAFGLPRSVSIIEPKVHEEVYAMHFGGDCQNLKLVRSKITKKTECSTNKDGSVKNVPMFHLKKPGTNCPFPEGASGCPVLTKPNETGKYGLVGLHFSGDEDDKVGTAEALQWTKGIREYINKGARIIRYIDTKLAYKSASAMGNLPADFRQKAQQVANDAMDALLGIADKNKLTIYLPTGEVLTV